MRLVITAFIAGGSLPLFLPQSKSDGAKFAFAVDKVGQEPADQFPDRIYLGWQPACRNPEDFPSLPIHDAIYVQRRHKSKTKTVLEKAWMEVLNVKFKPAIKIDTSVK